MDDSQIKDSLIALLDGIKRADGVVIGLEMANLDAAVEAPNHQLHPQLEHFLQRRSYAKALDFLGGATVGNGPGCGTRRPA